MNEAISPVLTVPAGGEAVHHSTDVDLWEKSLKAKVKVKARFHRKGKCRLVPGK